MAPIEESGDAAAPAEEQAAAARTALAERRAQKQHRQVNMICAHMGLNVASLCVALIARVSILREAGGLSGGRAAHFLALFSAGVGATEFLMNPISGKLSDAYGRKPFLMQAPLVSAILKLFVVLRPSVLTVGLERCLAGASTTVGGSTACSSALADILDDPKDLGRAYASLGAATGLGVVIGPLLGGFAGSPRRAFAAGALLSALQMIFVSARIQETLLPTQRKPLPGKDLLSAVNPLSVLRLYCHGPVVATLVTTAAVQCFCEGKSISDMNTYYLLNDAKFSEARRSLYITCLGIVMTASGVIGRHTIQLFGMRWHTTLQNFASALGFVVTGSSTQATRLFGALPIYAFGMERRAAVSSLAVKAAVSAGMGKGEFAAAFANLRAIAVGIAPLLYARIYTRTLAAKGWPGRPWYVAALMALIAEALHRTLSSKQLNFN